MSPIAELWLRCSAHVLQDLLCNRIRSLHQIATTRQHQRLARTTTPVTQRADGVGANHLEPQHFLARRAAKTTVHHLMRPQPVILFMRSLVFDMPSVKLEGFREHSQAKRSET